MHTIEHGDYQIRFNSDLSGDAVVERDGEEFSFTFPATLLLKLIHKHGPSLLDLESRENFEDEVIAARAAVDSWLQRCTAAEEQRDHWRELNLAYRGLTMARVLTECSDLEDYAIRLDVFLSSAAIWQDVPGIPGFHEGMPPGAKALADAIRLIAGAIGIVLPDAD